jgi:hypothetical protein
VFAACVLEARAVFFREVLGTDRWFFFRSILRIGRGTTDVSALFYGPTALRPSAVS